MSPPPIGSGIWIPSYWEWSSWKKCVTKGGIWVFIVWLPSVGSFCFMFVVWRYRLFLHHTCCLSLCLPTRMASPSGTVSHKHPFLLEVVLVVMFYTAREKWLIQEPISGCQVCSFLLQSHGSLALSVNTSTYAHLYLHFILCIWLISNGWHSEVESKTCFMATIFMYV